MTYFLIFLIKTYQKTISPNHGCFKFIYHSPVFSLNTGIFLGCRSRPTCSEYALKSIEQNGLRKGLLDSFERITNCL